MNLRKALSKEAICLALEGEDKQSIIEEMIDLLIKTGRINTEDRKTVLKAVLEREKKMSTGMHHGIAIPHGKTRTMDSLVAAIGIKKEGVPFDSLDGRPARLFILTISPAARTGPHIQFLAEISRLLHDEATREQVINAESDDEIYTIIMSSTRS